MKRRQFLKAAGMVTVAAVVPLPFVRAEVAEQPRYAIAGFRSYTYDSIRISQCGPFTITRKCTYRFGEVVARSWYCDGVRMYEEEDQYTVYFERVFSEYPYCGVLIEEAEDGGDYDLVTESVGGCKYVEIASCRTNHPDWKFRMWHIYSDGRVLEIP